MAGTTSTAELLARDWSQCQRCGEHVCEPGYPESTCDCLPYHQRPENRGSDMATRRFPGVWATRIRQARGLS